MKFSRCKVQNAIGHKLAHSHLGKSGRIPKASTLSESHVRDLIEAGVDSVEIVIAEAFDVIEDVVAERLIGQMDWKNCRGERANGGRFNIYSTCDGLIHFERGQVDSFNSISEEITLATVLPDTPVQAGDHIATLKIIPFYVHDKVVDEAERFLKSMTVSVMTWLTDLRVELVQSYNETITTKVQKKGYQTQSDRLAFYGLTELPHSLVQHDVVHIAEQIHHASSRGVDLVMVLGASAICDRQDVVPAALTSLGGHVSYFGMPVDPGNLMMVGHLDTMVVIGMPGCVRSPAFNGLDLVLDRLMAGLKLDPQHIQMMGVGGLLKGQSNRTIRETTSRKLLDLSA